MSAQRTDTYRVQRDEKYLRDLAAEAAYWDQPQIYTLDLLLPGLLDEYYNEQFTGDRLTPWWETIPRYGSFRRGCALGLGGLKRESRILELLPSLHLTIYDISEEALARRESELLARFPGRITTEVADLNFIQLAPDSYDFMLSDHCMHHVLNLEHIAYQINRALAPGGYFFLSDYVGEAKFQFAAEKKQRFEELIDQLRSRHPALRYWRAEWAQLEPWDFYSPFEAIRSDETLGIFRRYLSQVSAVSTGTLIFLVLWLRPTDQAAPVSLGPVGRVLRFALRMIGRYPDKSSGDLLSLLREVGRDLIRTHRTASSGSLLPNLAFAVYQKRANGAAT